MNVHFKIYLKLFPIKYSLILMMAAYLKYKYYNSKPVQSSTKENKELIINRLFYPFCKIRL